MTVQITKTELKAIADIATDIEAMMGCSEAEHGSKDYDTEARKRLLKIKIFFLKNGYKNPFTTI